MVTHRRVSSFGVALVVLALATISIGDPYSGSASPGGVQNPGFEDGLTSWTATAVDAAIVVGIETSAQCPSYTEMGGVTVAPYRGAKDLRLGACRQINQSQPKGTNKVSQTFTANSSPLRIATRLFSWDHKGNDQFAIDLKKGNQNVGTLQSALNFPMAGVPGGQRTCSGALPCKFTIDTGNSGQFVATDWITMAIDIPSSLFGQNLTLTYSVTGAKDNSFATWAYFDNVNTPPVARFEHDTLDVREGDLVQFTDTSFDPDGEPIVDWLWDINGETITEQNPIFIPPDEGMYTACLTVTDAFGDTNRVCSGAIASDGTEILTLSIDNQPPLTNALNVETLAGQPVALFGRTIEPGWEDQLTAAWQVDGQSPPAATLTDDHLPFLSTGIVTGEVTTSTSVSGTLTIQDQDGGTGSDNFQITVVPNDNQRHEPNNALVGAPVLVTDSSNLSWIQSIGDQDFFEARLADGSLLPAGGQLLVALNGPGGAGLNADYDLVILSELPGGVGGFQSGDSGQTNVSTQSIESAGWRGGGWRGGGWRGGGWRGGGWRGGGWRGGGWRGGSLLYPLSQVGYNGLEGENVGAADITLDELGLGTPDGSLSVAAYSASTGTDQEVAIAQSDVPGTKFYVGVLGANGAFSGSQPYTLSIETSVPEDPVFAFGPEVCNKSPLVGSDPSNPPTTTVVDLNPGFPSAGAAKTLLVTSRERLIAVADDPSTPANEGLAEWSALEPKLQALAGDAKVMADVVSVPSTWFDNWDSNPCDVNEANAVASNVRGLVQSRLAADPTIQYLVIGGGGDIIPQRRVPDETIIGNESSYTLDALLNPSSPLFWSLAGGFILTDDYFVDAVPTPWQGRELYNPDIPVGRLAETMPEIGAAADAFVSSAGLLDYSTVQNATAAVTGYDFFSDGANVTAANLGSKLATSTLIDETPADTSDDWTADDLRCVMLGETGCNVPSVIAANAHWLHYALLSANGFSNNNFEDIINSNETAAAGGGSALAGRVVFTMGCHGGFNVPDREALPADPGLGIDPSLDFVQAMARQRAVFIASTGYGLGDDLGLAGTELLLTYFSDEMVQGGAFIGEALVNAKETFFLSLSSMTAYDEKSSIQLTMFGLPMYEVVVPAGPGSVTPLQAQQEDSQNFSLTVQDGATETTTQYEIQPVDTPNGQYFTARPVGSDEEGDAQATAFRAVEPRIVIPITGGPVQGVLIKSGTYTDTPGFDPVISRPTQEWLIDDHEPDTCLEAYWPSVPVTVNSVDPGGVGPQALVVTPGQFRCTGLIVEPPSETPRVEGIQRNYTSLTIELLPQIPPLPPGPPDEEPPTVHEVSLATGAIPNSLDVTVDASDPSGIAAGALLKYSAGTITSIPFEGGNQCLNDVDDDGDDFVNEGCQAVAIPEAGNQCLNAVDDDGDGAVNDGCPINVPNALSGDDIAGQIRDTRNNVATFTAKALIGYTFLDVSLTPDPQYVTPGEEVEFQLSVADFGSLDEPFFTIDFGDGLFGSGPVTAAVMTITHTYAEGTEFPTTAKVRVMDADGRLGSDIVTVRLKCDPIGDTPNTSFDWVSCDVSTTPTTMTIAVRVVGAIDNTGQYRVNIQTATKNAQLKFDNGQATGPLSSLVVTLGDPGELRFTFSLEEVGLANGGSLEWFAEAQTVGFPDRMPDSGVFTFVVP